MKNFWYSYIFVSSVFLCFSAQANAAINNSSSSLVNTKKSCLDAPRLCIYQVDESISNIKKHSIQWYRLINLKLLAIWEIRDAKWMKQEINKYVDLNDAPPVLLTTVYTLHAKMLFSDGNVTQGNLYANKAVELIKQVNEVSFDAARYAEIIILYNQLNQRKNAIEFINWINQRIARMGPAHYFPNLQTAIAHTYFKTADYDLALSHYQNASTGFIEASNLLATAESYHNIARALQGKNEYSRAITAFKKALQWMEPAVKSGGYAITAKNYTQLRLIETLQQNKQFLQAKLLLKQIKPKEVNQSSLTLYQQLKLIQLNQ